MQAASDGAVIDVLDSGGSGPPLLMLHGFALTKSIWEQPAQRLAAGARVVRCDLRGFGKSSAPGGPYLVETLAGDLAAILDRLEIERAIVVGHGYSAGIALTFFRMFEERVLALGLIAGTGSAPDSAASGALLELASATERDGIAPLLERWYPLMLSPQTYAEQPELAAELRAMMAASDPVGVAANLRGMALSAGCDDVLEDVGVPVCVIAGARDAFCEAAAMRALHARIQHAEFELLASGHVPALEAPAALSAALERLVARI